VPPVAISTTLPTEGDHVPQLAFDGKADTYFASSRPAKADDTFTMELAEPARLKRVEVVTGKPDGKAALVKGVLEVSADGKTFQQVAAFESGVASVKVLEPGRTIKALRLRASADDPAPLAVREITLDSTPPVPVFKYPLEVRLDCSEVPEMKAWCERAKGLVEQWYPVLCDLLPSDGFTPARRINLVFKKSDSGIAATGGNTITCSDGWFKAHPADYGAIIHESIHVIQAYPRGSPGWLVEGLDDYMRFWIYEPQTPKRPLDPNRIKYTDSYQVTAAFLAYLVKTYDKDFVAKLNAACRKGQYKDDLFKQIAGKDKDLDALWDEFKKSLPQK
jgi:hypothetical protein